MNTLFELQRLWDYWPHLRNVKALKDVFRQGSGATSVKSVFVIAGHVFLFTPSSDEDGCLHVFDCVPRAVVGAREQAPQSSALHTRCGVLEVLELNAEGALRIAVVQRSGELTAYRFDTTTLQWRCLGTEQRLSTCAVRSVAFCVKTSTFVFCEQLEEKNGLLCRVTVRKLDKVDDSNLSLGTPEVILNGCPPLAIHAMADWTCFTPQEDTPYPAGLLLFWWAGLHHVQGYVWHAAVPAPQPCPCTDFKSLCLHFSGLCSSLLPGKPSLVALSSNPASNQLIALDSVGQLTCFSYGGGEVVRRALPGLADIPAWFQSLQPHPNSGVKLTSLYTYWCVFNRGIVRVYDSLSGELMWQCDDHEGVGAIPWFSSSPLQLSGFITEQDIWVLKSKQMPMHAQCMIEGCVPVTMDMEEAANGKYLDNSYWLCQAWGLDLQATRYCLDSIYAMTKGIDEGTLPDEQVLPYLPQPLVDALPKVCLQNPSLSVALLVKFPIYRTQLKAQVSNFLDSYKSGQDWLLNTQLNADTVQMLMEFVELCNKYDSILDSCLTSTQQPASTTRQHVINILTQAYTTVIVGDDEGSTPLELHSLVQRCPEEVLAGIRGFLEAPSFRQAVEELKAGRWCSAVNVNWRRVFANEMVRHEAQRGSPVMVPLFEVTCRLLYQLEPLELVQFVEFAKLSRAKSEGSYMKEHTMAVLCQRAVEALAPLVSDRSAVSVCHPDAVKEYCQLLLLSQCSNAEVAVANLLVSQKMWTDAILLVTELKKKTDDTRSSDIHQAVFHLVLTSLSEASVLRDYLEEMWALVPKHFSVFDFLHILKDGTVQSHDGVFVHQQDDLAVRDVVSKVLQLLQSSRIDPHLLDVSTVRTKL